MNLEEEKESSFNHTPKSFWLNDLPDTNYPVLNEDISVDIAIIGGGITGITTGYLLSKQGANVAIFEADHILQGTTGHTTAKITSQHGLIYSKIRNNISEEYARQYAEANETAIQIIAKLVDDYHIDCDYINQSAYVYTLQDKYIDKIYEEATIASTLGIKSTFLEMIPLPFPVKAAVRFENQAQFHPLKFLYPLAKEYIKNGGHIYEETRIENIEENGAYTLIARNGKKVTAGKVIIASHYPCNNKRGLYFARIYPERSYVVAARIKENYPGGMYVTAEEPGRSFRSQMYNGRELILISGQHHKTGQGEDTNNHYETLMDFANLTFPIEDFPFRWSTQDCMTLDDIPYVGNYTSDTPNLYVATGFGKWGMSNSMASAMILSDLILKGSSPWQDVYRPSRNTLTASTKNFVIENLNVAKELIKGKFSSLSVHIDLKEGEGKVAEVNGQRAGVYKDEEGNLHIVNTTCPHMGCELNWNAAERTWDCPCHGSRFSIDGQVVEGPAVKALDMDNDVSTIEKLLKDDF